MLQFWGGPLTDKQHDVFLKDHRTVAFYVYFVSNSQKNVSRDFLSKHIVCFSDTDFQRFCGSWNQGEQRGRSKPVLKARLLA